MSPPNNLRITKQNEPDHEKEGEEERKRRKKEEKEQKQENKAKQTTGALKNVMQESERKGKAAIVRGTPYVLKRSRYLLHGQNNTEKITAVARIKQHEEDTAVLRTKTTRRRGKRNRHETDGEGNKRETKRRKKKERTTASHHCRFRAPPIELNDNKQNRNYHSL